MIETENLTKTFETTTAVNNLTLKIKEGEVFGFLGPNGAGKTTTIRMLCCLISKTSGNARIGDYEIGNKADTQKIRKITGLLPENVGLYEDLSAYKNLDFYGKIYKLPETQRQERIQRYLTMLGLWEKKDRPAGSFSKGMKQKLAIARALIHDPQVIFLDEPTANLDPEAAKTVREFILELKKEKRTIFINTHLLDEAQRICDRVGVLKTNLLSEGTPEDLRMSLWGTKTVIGLENINETIVAAVKRGQWKIEISGNKLIVSVSLPEKENPEILDAISKAGGRIQSVTQTTPTLEDVYLKLVRS
ncbi:MAG: ABC transporter ATP-binding protein [Candidatus Bathyarchaeota archaeon]|nr:ABC transporter ATP-binding protein [Candidatus Bathyarchaeota archaeon]